MGQQIPDMPTKAEKPPPKAKPEPAKVKAKALDWYCEVGDSIQWFSSADKNERPVPAMVTRIGLETIDVLVFHPGSATAIPYDGVHHFHHQTKRVDSSGAWLPREVDVAWRRMLVAGGWMKWDDDTKYIATQPETKKQEAAPSA